MKKYTLKILIIISIISCSEKIEELKLGDNPVEINIDIPSSIPDARKEGTNVLDYATLKSCWPPWDRHHLPEARRQRITDPNIAQDGFHYGDKHHKAFAELFLSRFGQKFR